MSLLNAGELRKNRAYLPKPRMCDLKVTAVKAMCASDGLHDSEPGNILVVFAAFIYRVSKFCECSLDPEYVYSNFVIQF